MRKARIALALSLVLGSGFFFAYKVGGLQPSAKSSYSHLLSFAHMGTSPSNHSNTKPIVTHPVLPSGIHQVAVHCDSQGICQAASPAAPADCSSNAIAGLAKVMSEDEASVMSGLSPPVNHLDPDSLSHARLLAGPGVSYSVLRVTYQNPQINSDKEGKWASIKYLVLFQSSQEGTLHTFGYSRGLIAQCANNQWKALGQEDVGWN